MTNKTSEKSGIKSISLNITGQDGALSTQTMDISTSGAYCRTAKPLPLMSKIAITLVIPDTGKRKKEKKSINCGGTVVRTHPVIVDGKTCGYDVAIFFNELGDEDKHLLSEYLGSNPGVEEE